jgi:hypothetical protein
VTLTYRPNHAGTRDILRSPEMGRIVADAAEVISERAKSIAPVRSGAYRESIKVVSDVHASRVASHIGPHVPYGLIVELHDHTMRRALG